ncbi:uroporphyrinogen-III synthase [Telmatobacter bradus]|uniref:uroporphyrinogen-III synthase n=1 Tax=Telmatobacter bradus TaxID=474953 RepID=UPI003B4398AF
MTKGRRVLVTRAAHQAGRLSEALRARGLEPVEVPVLSIEAPADCSALDEAIRSIASYDWLILTSGNTVRALVDRAAELGLSLALVAALQQVAAVGSATARAAEKAGLKVALVPETYVAESLVESLQGQVFQKKILLARAEVARDVIPDALRAAGALVDVVDAYRNVLPAAAPALLRAALEEGIAAATFTSSSSVTHLASAAQAAGIDFPFDGVKAISIGPITSETLRNAGWELAAEAVPCDIPGLVEAVNRIVNPA